MSRSPAEPTSKLSSLRTYVTTLLIPNNSIQKQNTRELLTLATVLDHFFGGNPGSMRCALPALQSSRVRRSRQQLGHRPASRARARSSRRERFEARAGGSDSKEGDVGSRARSCARLGNRPGRPLRPPGKRGPLADAPEGSRPEAADVEHYGNKYSRNPQQGIGTRTETRTEGDEGAWPPAKRFPFPGRCNPARASGAGNFIPRGGYSPRALSEPCPSAGFHSTPPIFSCMDPERSSYLFRGRKLLLSIRILKWQEVSRGAREAASPRRARARARARTARAKERARARVASCSQL